MKSSRILIAALIALSFASEAVDAHARHGRFCRSSANNAMRDFAEEPMWTLYYCVGGRWVARACGTDIDALRKLAELEIRKANEWSTPARRTAISVFLQDPRKASEVTPVIAPFGSLDGSKCGGYTGGKQPI